MRRLLRLRDPGLFVVGCVCIVVALALVAVPLGWAGAGVSFLAMDLVFDRDGEPE